jgi:hypothetical protein
VRQWARKHGLDVGDRGRLPVEVLESYLARSSVVREWARKKGKPIGARGRIPNDVIQSYLAPYRELTRKAA